MTRPWTTNLIVVAIGLAVFGAVNLRSGRIEANDGLGGTDVSTRTW